MTWKRLFETDAKRMTEDPRGIGFALPHIVVTAPPISMTYRPPGGGNTTTRQVGDRRQHAEGLLAQLEAANVASRAAATDLPGEAKPDGMILAFEAWPGFELALESLDLRGSGIELVVVQPGSDNPPRSEMACVFVPYEHTDEFVRRLQEFADQDTKKGHPKNQGLVANIASIRLAVLEALWTDSTPFPDRTDSIWWELWLRNTPDSLAALDQVAATLNWSKAAHVIAFPDRVVTAVRTDAAGLSRALGSRLPIAEIRRARLAQSPAELRLDQQRVLVSDLAGRVIPCGEGGPVVCLLDTGAYRHSLLAASLGAGDMHHVVGLDDFDQRGHGTKMAGLALYADLTESLTSLDSVVLEHRLESVKIFPDPGAPPNLEDTYGFVTASGTDVAEQAHPDRRRAFCMAVTDGETDGRPTLWSATVDALAFGTDVERTEQGLKLLTEPMPEKGRLFVLSAGNVYPEDYRRDYLDVCDTRVVQDPSQSWNALTVGGYTDLTDVPAGPDFAGYSALASSGELSPFSRTSRLFASRWPIKPEIVLEAGNLLISSSQHPSIYEHDVVSLVTTSLEEQDGRTPLGTISMTSAATAQAARLAAVASARYPSFWPETIRGLLVHAAEWTDPMLAEVMNARGKTERTELLRRYGYGVPTEERVLRSASNAVTMICQGSIQPYERHGGRTTANEIRIHDLPWPRRELLDLHDTEVRIRVTLSYFIEPNPSSRTWKRRYAYRSHGLRFDVRKAGETNDQFRQRVSQQSVEEDSDATGEAGQDHEWLIGAKARNLGSLHSDVYSTTAAELADSGAIGVFPVGGWWKNGTRHDRAQRSVRYALLVSLMTPRTDIDLYTPIAVQIGIPVEIEG
jgi:hypothetical protein